MTGRATLDRGADGAPFERVLVANRGEIAVRIIRACHDLGCQAVAIYSDADVCAPHVRAADAAVRVGPAPAAESYLRVDAVLAAAHATGCQAVHPGYGFLSERPELARACEAAGLAFVGPAPETIAGLGDKLAARRGALAAGVPIVPGTLDPVPLDDPAAVADILAAAEQIGWSIMVKATAGGGGRGMRRVETARDLERAVRAASDEARAAFGDGSVYLERYVPRARHVEVQLLGDAHGGLVAVGERDCSIQRRHQKLVEEAPVPGLTSSQRRALDDMAVAVGRAFRVRNAVTAEFLLTPDGEFWFLEVNTRLQVEHGVTELVSGLDLVREQLWIAAGAPLSGPVLAAARASRRPRRHAIEMRVSAEDPARDFLPTAGRITRWRLPAGPGVRVDAGAEEGAVVGTEYDPLLAKLLVVDDDRPRALARLRRALREFEVGGLQTTLPFHRWLASDDAFARADLSTALVADRWHPAPLRAAAAGAAAHLAAAAAQAGGRGALTGCARLDEEGDPPGPWRVSGPGSWDGQGAATGSAAGPQTPSGVRSDRPPGTAGWLRAARREAVDRWPV